MTTVKERIKQVFEQYTKDSGIIIDEKVKQKVLQILAGEEKQSTKFSRKKNMIDVEERIKKQSKVPFNSEGHPLFADSIKFWKNSSEVSPNSLLTNGWIKVSKVLPILKEEKEKWRELLNLVESRPKISDEKYQTHREFHIYYHRDLDECFQKIIEKLKSMELQK